MIACPSTEALRDLLRGTVPAVDADPLRDHLGGCAACLDELDRLSDDPDLARWVAEGMEDRGGPSSRDLVRDRVRAARDAAPRTTWDPGGTDCGLGPPDREGNLGRIGPYRVEAVLGRGGMGVVLRGFDEELQRVVALKVIQAGPAGERARARFVREARAAARVEHDHIVRVYAVANPPDGPPYLVMEYLDGSTLADRLRRRGWLAPREAAEVTAQVADGLAAAHDAGLIHRDVKPANILFDSATGRAKIADFGLARPSTRPIVETQVGSIAGTPAYMSPEQAQGRDEPDPRSDVYSLGATLYEALTGELPFRGAPHLVIQQILSDEPRPLRRLRDTIPRDLETVCLKAMAKEPHRRYASASELGDDLRRWLRGEAVRARPLGPAGRLWRVARRKPLATALASALGLVLLVGSVIVVTLWRRAEASAARARAHLADADRNYRQARDAVDKFYTEFYLGGLPNGIGLEAARHRAIQDMLGYYREFLRQRGDDPSLRSDLAEASFRVGTLATQFGDKRDALDAFRHARDLFEAIARGDAGNREARRKLALCHRNMGALLETLGRTPEALATHRSNNDLLRSLVASAPGDPEWRRLLGSSLGSLANTHAFRSENAEAVALYEEARGQFAALVRLDPANDRCQADLSMTLNNMALAVAEPRDRLPLLREALALREGLMARSPNADTRRNVARTRQNLGTTFRALGQPAEAERHLREAAEALRRINRDAPGLVIHRGDQAEACNELAGILVDLGRPVEALQAAGEALEILDELTPIDPENARFRLERAENHLAAARAHERQGDLDRALRSRRARLPLLERIARDPPDNAKARADSVDERAAIAALLAKLGRAGEAIDHPD